MFLARMAWAGSIDQLTTAWTFAALILVSTPVRSVASFSYTSLDDDLDAVFGRQFFELRLAGLAETGIA